MKCENLTMDKFLYFQQCLLMESLNWLYHLHSTILLNVSLQKNANI